MQQGGRGRVFYGAQDGTIQVLDPEEVFAAPLIGSRSNEPDADPGQARNSGAPVPGRAGARGIAASSRGPTASVEGGAVTDLAASPAASLLLSVSASGVMQTWSLSDLAPMAKLESVATPLRFTQLTPDGRHVLAVSADNEVVMWDGRTGKIVSRAKDLVDASGTLALSPDGRQLLVSKGTTLSVLDIGGNASGGPCASMEFSDDGRRLYTAGWGGKAQV